MIATPLRNKIQSLLPTCADCATFIGSGILSHSYSTIWINDPTTKSGVVLAGFFNATALGIANYFGKTEEKSSLGFKIILTVGTLAIATFTTPYLAIALKDRFAIVLTTQVALHIGGLNLAAKATTYILYIFGSRLISVKQPKTEPLSSEIKQYYEFFKNNHGNWVSLTNEKRLAYLNDFFKNDLPFFSSDEEMIYKMDFSKNPKDIQNFSKNQASWLNEILLSSSKPLSEEISQPYALLFYQHDLPYLFLGYITLPKLHTPDQIRALTFNQLLWHKNTRNLEAWKSLSLELQYVFNQKCLECGIYTWLLHPSSKEDIKKADLAIIAELCKGIRDSHPLVWIQWESSSRDYYTSEMQKVVMQRKKELCNPIVQNMTSVQQIEELSGKAVNDCHHVFSIVSDEELPSIDVQIALSKRFIDCNLLPPRRNWHCKCDVPTTPEGFTKLEDLQISWLSNHFYREPARWKSLNFACQARCNNRMSKVEYTWNSWKPITSIPTVEDFTVENIGSFRSAHDLCQFYAHDKNSPWASFDHELKRAIIRIFSRYGVPISNRLV